MVDARERDRLLKAEEKLDEEDRLRKLSKAADVRKDIEETLGTDVVKHDKLVQLAEAIWFSMPPSERSHFTAEDWQKSIMTRCKNALIRAEEKLAENKVDEKLFVAKVKILRQTFHSQVLRAMTEVSEKYKPQPAAKAPAARR